MNEPTREPFQRQEHIDKPGIIGAAWWQRSLESAPDPVSRRQAMQSLVVGAAVLGVGGVAVAMMVAAGSSSPSSDDYRTESKNSLAMQQELGWSFGATSESLTFDGQTKRPFDRGALLRLADDLRPSNASYVPWYVPTLFLSPSAARRTVPREEDVQPTPLTQVIEPIFTPAMDAAYRRGRALASLFSGVPANAAVIVDLPGPEAVAFAAGAVSVFDPVFALDNWPHPRGVVRAHQALAAAAYYQPLFARRAKGASAPLFVLDRGRLNPYTDDATQFDNRHLARLPRAGALKALGFQRVLYVAPLGSDRELDDLNDDFVLYAASGLGVKIVGADAFGPDPAPVSTPSDDDAPRYYYGRSADSHLWFWTDYPWYKPAVDKKKPPVAPRMVSPGPSYTPTPRSTPFSSGQAGGSGNRTMPASFGTVPVVISVATGLILGAKIYRSGSWNRTGSSSWGS